MSSDHAKISTVAKIVFPGVGSFDSGMKNIENLGLTPVLQKKVLKDRIPTLDICLNMQLLTKMSEEGVLDGIGFIDAETVKLDINGYQEKPRIPHMDWNFMEVQQDHLLFKNMPEARRFDFVSAIIDHNISGVQSNS